MLWKQNLREVERHCRRPAPYTVVITFDGTLTGGGATLQVGVRDRAETRTKPVIAYWADRWRADDIELMQFAPGDSAGQAKCEALTLLVSIATWRPILEATQGLLTFVGNALGVLHDALKLKAHEPVLNGIMGELALLLAPSARTSGQLTCGPSATHLRRPQSIATRRTT